VTTLTLLVKALHSFQLKQVAELLKNHFEELDVKVDVLGTTSNRWVQVSVSGEDQAIATSYIKKEIGICPSSLDNVQLSSELKGYISKIDANGQELWVDVGVFEPKVVQATISAGRLRDQLMSGKEVGLNRISEIYGLAEGLPLSIKVVSFGKGEALQGELSEAQVKKFFEWQQSLLDRLIILGASRSAVKSVLDRTGLFRDIIDLESLGVFENALTCKLGTDAAGLIPIIGRYLRNSFFAVFNPKKNPDFHLVNMD
jgi:hypothetical protein